MEHKLDRPISPYADIASRALNDALPVGCGFVVIVAPSKTQRAIASNLNLEDVNLLLSFTALDMAIGNHGPPIEGVDTKRVERSPLEPLEN